MNLYLAAVLWIVGSIAALLGWCALVELGRWRRRRAFRRDTDAAIAQANSAAAQANLEGYGRLGRSANR